MAIPPALFPALQRFIVDYLKENEVSDADPNLFSQFILAMLKKQMSPKDLKAYCVGQLTGDFDVPQERNGNIILSCLCGQYSIMGFAEAEKLVDSVFEKAKTMREGSHGVRSVVKRGRPLPPGPSSSKRLHTAIQRCPAYENEGFCVLGEKCPLIHEGTPVVANTVADALKKVGQPVSGGMQPMDVKYDPNQPHPGAGIIPPFQTRAPDGGKGNSAGGSGGKKRNFGAAMSRTLTLHNVPRELNTMAKVVEHFSKFGDVLHVELLPHTKKAHVTFAHVRQAQGAKRSTDAVLGNRFIKVSWCSAKAQDQAEESAESAEEVAQRELEAAQAKLAEAKKKQEEEIAKFEERETLLKKQMSDLKSMVEQVAELPEGEERDALVEQLEGRRRAIKTSMAKLNRDKADAAARRAGLKRRKKKA